MNSDDRFTGRIVRWDVDAGYGFIQEEQAERAGREELTFAHVTDLRFVPEVGMRVGFGLGRDREGRQTAIDVRWLVQRR